DNGCTAASGIACAAQSAGRRLAKEPGAARVADRATLTRARANAGWNMVVLDAGSDIEEHEHQRLFLRRHRSRSRIVFARGREGGSWRRVQRGSRDVKIAVHDSAALSSGAAIG